MDILVFGTYMVITCFLLHDADGAFSDHMTICISHVGKCVEVLYDFLCQF